MIGCELCEQPGASVLWSDDDWRVVRVGDAAFPAYYRAIAQRHVAEFSELTDAQRQRCMAIVCAVERTLIDTLQPTKINLAALGNMVPHLHWHIVARFAWDSHFPQSIWGTAQRAAGAAEQRLALPLDQLDAAVSAALAKLVVSH